MPGGTEDLVSRLVSEVLRFLREEEPPVGTALTERALAERLRVSRSPVRKTLRELHERGHVSRTESGRYLVEKSGSDVGEVADLGVPAEGHYLQIASDRLDGLLPERVTENALIRRYGLTRSRLTQVLLRISHEGWITPLPGYGWQFLPMLTSLQSYEDSYNFRVVIEPAAILERTFNVNHAALKKRRDEQQNLVDGQINEVSGAELFDLNTRFHETIIECSNNDFFIESLTRINRLRRLIEYRQALVSERAIARCREHIALADLLLAGRPQEASEFLREHLTGALSEKVPPY